MDHNASAVWNADSRKNLSFPARRSCRHSWWEKKSSAKPEPSSTWFALTCMTSMWLDQMRDYFDTVVLAHMRVHAVAAGVQAAGAAASAAGAAAGAAAPAAAATGGHDWVGCSNFPATFTVGADLGLSARECARKKRPRRRCSTENITVSSLSSSTQREKRRTKSSGRIFWRHRARDADI